MASIVVLVSVVHLFLFPVVPSLDYFSARQPQNSCIPINGSIKGGKDKVVKNTQPVPNLDVRFPVDLHKAVVYRGAPWKAEIGRWLSGCNSITTAVKVFEVLGCNCLSRFSSLLPVRVYLCRNFGVMNILCELYIFLLIHNHVG